MKTCTLKYWLRHSSHYLKKPIQSARKLSDLINKVARHNINLKTILFIYGNNVIVEKEIRKSLLLKIHQKQMFKNISNQKRERFLQ